MLGEHVFDLAGRDVLAAADDDVLHAVGDRQEAVGVETPLVAGAEPTPVDERLVIERLVPVAEELARPSHQDLALVARRHVDAVFVDEADLVARPDLAVGRVGACRPGDRARHR